MTAFSQCVFGCKHLRWLVCRLGVGVLIAAGSSQRKSFVPITYFVLCCALRGDDTFSSFISAGERTPANCMKITQPRVRKSYKMTETTFPPAFEGNILVKYMLRWFLVGEIVASLLFIHHLPWLLILTPVLALCVETSPGCNQDKRV